MKPADPYDLQRFVDAQRTVYPRVDLELQSGRKTNHWMWFIFPQIAGLGHSPMAKKYAISSLGEARAYLDHPLLGQRLRHCSRLVTCVQGKSVEDIFGYPDYLKFQSSMTLFARATTDNQVFLSALEKYFRSEFDQATLERLG
jgi:uncharacterized protein (DUF1810 family)